MQPNVSINHDGIFKNMSVLYSHSRIFVIPVYISKNLVDTIGTLSALRMHGLHDKRHLLAKLRIAGSENWEVLSFVKIEWRLDVYQDTSLLDNMKKLKRLRYVWERGRKNSKIRIKIEVIHL